MADRRLCDLINASILPHLVSNSTSLNREAEKDLLIALTQVSREIERWIDESDARSEQQEVILEQICDAGHNCFQQLEQPFTGDDSCLANVVSAMVAFQSFDNRFVQHVSGNILVLASCFLAQYGNKWVKFLRLLWISLETSVSSICIGRSSSSLVEYAILADQSLMPCSLRTNDDILVTDEPICHLTNFIALLQSRSVNTNSFVVAGLFQILRRILKLVKQDSGELEENFMHLALSSLLRMSWNKFSTSQVLISEANSGRLPDQRNYSERKSDVLLGSVVQLFCSLVENKDQEDGVGLTEFSVYVKFTDRVSNLICCFFKHLGHDDKHICGYFRHKVLMLMIRLSYYESWKSCCPKSWLKLLKQYFKDLLYQPISGSDAGLENSLDESPFLPSFTDGNELHYQCTQNLRRQAIFLLLKCCFSLFRVSKDTCQACECAVATWPSTCGVQLCGEDCCRRGLLELFEWFQRSCLLDMFVDYEDYLKSCGRFALSFLQLYAEDDDMLLDMLLQLLDAPLFTLHMQNNTRGRSFEELKSDIHFLFSSIFNPIHLFHLFLLVLHYDHSVLIDYLITKDTGVRCVKYLLRCLRVICESWLIFVNFTIPETEINQPRHKRRKIAANNDCSSKSRAFPSSSALGKRQHSGKHKTCSIIKGINVQTYLNAKECLLCLKRSVEDLHYKKLFPYNPGPLLRSLSRFQNLCENEECVTDNTRDPVFSPC